MNHLVSPKLSEKTDRSETDLLPGNIIGAAIDLHRVLGSGLLE